MRELPRLYPILDADALARTGVSLRTAGLALYAAGARWVQYRDKRASDNAMAARLGQLRAIFPAGQAVLVVNDRVHLCAQTGADGVHLGQQDMDLKQARRILGPHYLVGISTHTTAQLSSAIAAGAADYLAIGPVFATASKENPDPVVGLEGVRAARALTRLPLVAIGGITSGNAQTAIDAGADSVAAISALLPEVEERVRDFLAHLR